MKKGLGIFVALLFCVPVFAQHSASELPVEYKAYYERTLFVDGVLARPDTLQPLIVGNPAEENELIDFALSQQITFLALYDLGLLFDQVGDEHEYILDSKARYKVQLSKFLAKCNQVGISCGMVINYDGAQGFAQKLAAIERFNARYPVPLRFMVLEHEFWRAYSVPAYKKNGAAQRAPKMKKANRKPKLLVDHFEAVWENHLDALQQLHRFNQQSEGCKAVFDYVSLFYLNWHNEHNTHASGNISAATDKANAIAALTDGLFLYYYQDAQDSLGLRFLTPSAAAPQDFEPKRWQNRLQQLAEIPADYQVMPLFSAEYFRSEEDYCGYVRPNDTTNFLGNYLFGGQPAAVAQQQPALATVEEIYLQQHQQVAEQVKPYVLPVTTGFGWFKYSCFRHHTLFCRGKLGRW